MLQNTRWSELGDGKVVVLGAEVCSSSVIVVNSGLLLTAFDGGRLVHDCFARSLLLKQLRAVDRQWFAIEQLIVSDDDSLVRYSMIDLDR